MELKYNLPLSRLVVCRTVKVNLPGLLSKTGRIVEQTWQDYFVKSAELLSKFAEIATHNGVTRCDKYNKDETKLLTLGTKIFFSFALRSFFRNFATDVAKLLTLGIKRIKILCSALVFS